jgi:carbonic anhydrase
VDKLIKGFERFHSTYYQSRRPLFESLATGQRPETLFITCSDSRVVPDLMMQTEPGELFVLRNAGNLVPPHDALDGGESATIEYAVAVLGVRDVVVCGHSDCGAMKAVLDPSGLDGLPKVASWLAHAKPALASSNGERLTLDRLVERNVLTQLEHLKTLPAVARRLEQGDLALHGWRFDIASGVVHAYDEVSGAFQPLARERTLSAGTERRTA